MQHENEVILVVPKMMGKEGLSSFDLLVISWPFMTGPMHNTPDYKFIAVVSIYAFVQPWLSPVLYQDVLIDNARSLPYIHYTV